MKKVTSAKTRFAAAIPNTIANESPAPPSRPKGEDPTSSSAARRMPITPASIELRPSGDQ